MASDSQWWVGKEGNHPVYAVQAWWMSRLMNPCQTVLLMNPYPTVSMGSRMGKILCQIVSKKMENILWQIVRRMGNILWIEMMMGNILWIVKRMENIPLIVRKMENIPWKTELKTNLFLRLMMIPFLMTEQILSKPPWGPLGCDGVQVQSPQCQTSGY